MAKFTIRKMLKTASLSLCLPLLAMVGCTSATKDPGNSPQPTEDYTKPINKTYVTDTQTLGLTVDENGTILLAGKPFYAFGVNSFTMVIRYIEGAGKSMYRDQFELLKKYGIPFVRVNFGGFYQDYYQKFDEDPEKILDCMREVVACAEEYQIGLICSLLWYDSAIPAHVEGHRSDMGNLDSNTVKYAVEYTGKIVNEFKDSPAVWAWEIGNEYNLGADLCDPEFKAHMPMGPCTPKNPTGFDFYTSEELVTFYTAVGNKIREYDKTRMISTGNGDMRVASKALHNSAAAKDPETHLWQQDWTTDSVEDFQEMCVYFTPDPLDTICFHLQHAQQDEEGNASFLIMLNRYGSKISTRRYFDEYVIAARKAKKALYFGEMGDMMWMEDHEEAPSIFKSVTDWIVDSGIQLASSWQFDKSNLVASDRGIDGEKLKIMQEKNQQYLADGKMDTATYWANK